jgi:hypothetical protein
MIAPETKYFRDLDGVERASGFDEMIFGEGSVGRE